MFFIFLNHLVKEMGGEVTVFADDTRLFNTEEKSNYGNTDKTN